MNFIKKYKLHIVIIILTLSIASYFLLKDSPTTQTKESALISDSVIQNSQNSTKYSKCQYDGEPETRCEISAVIIGGYTVEMIHKYGSYFGYRPDELFETNLRILEVVQTPIGLAHKTIFELTGNPFITPHVDLVNWKDFTPIKSAEDFKKLKLYSLESVGDSIIVFQYSSGGTCCNANYILRLDVDKFEVLPESLIDKLRSLPTN